MSTNSQLPVIIIGSGAAGSVLARELGRAKIKTIILEQGPFLTPKEVSRDPVQTKYNNLLLADPSKYSFFFQNRTSKVIHKHNPTWGACVGGSTVHFSGNAMRFHQEDFNQKNVSGSILGADLVNWPLTYDQIKFYYDKVEKEVGISGLTGSNPFAPTQDQPYPMPPYPRSSAGAIFENASLSAGLHPFPTPKFINTKHYNGRSECSYQGLCGGYMCHTNAKGSALVTMIPEAIQSGHVKIKTNCKVSRIQLDSNGKFKRVIYLNQDNKEETLKGSMVVICANPIETVRLLLLSENNKYPTGLLNNQDQVGRYFMIPVTSTAYSLHPHSLGYYGNAATRRVEDYYDQRKEFDFAGGFVLGEIQSPLPTNTPIPTSTLYQYKDWGKEKIKFLHDFPNNVMIWVSSGSCLAQQGNRITLHSTEKDIWGLPAPLVKFAFHDMDKRLMQFSLNVLSELILHSDTIKTWSSVSPDINSMGPLFMGGCRMGATPGNSVVNSFGQSHLISNLFVMGTSIFPTSGRDSPTQTIMALAFRTADHIIQNKIAV